MLGAGCSLVCCKSRSVLELLGRHDKSFSSYISQLHRQGFAVDHKLGNVHRMNGAGSRLFSTGNGQTWIKLHANTVNHVTKAKVVQPPAVPDSPKLIFPRWIKWVFGSGVTLSIPTWKEDWRKLRRIGGEAEIVIEEVESVAEVVEKVATVAEKISAEVADKLPENGKLKEAALFVERVSKETAHDAHLTTDFIHKVDALKEDMEALALESMINDQIAKQGSVGK